MLLLFSFLFFCTCSVSALEKLLLFDRSCRRLAVQLSEVTGDTIRAQLKNVAARNELGELTALLNNEVIAWVDRSVKDRLLEEAERKNWAFVQSNLDYFSKYKWIKTFADLRQEQLTIRQREEGIRKAEKDIIQRFIQMRDLFFKAAEDMKAKEGDEASQKVYNQLLRTGVNTHDRYINSRKGVEGTTFEAFVQYLLEKPAAQQYVTIVKGSKPTSAGAKGPGFLGGPIMLFTQDQDQYPLLRQYRKAPDMESCLLYMIQMLPFYSVELNEFKQRLLDACRCDLLEKEMADLVKQGKQKEEVEAKKKEWEKLKNKLQQSATTPAEDYRTEALKFLALLLPANGQMIDFLRFLDPSQELASALQGLVNNDPDRVMNIVNVVTGKPIGTSQNLSYRLMYIIDKYLRRQSAGFFGIRE